MQDITLKYTMRHDILDYIFMPGFKVYKKKDIGLVLSEVLYNFV